MENEYSGVERRESVRLDYVSPLNYKVCKQDTISKLLQGYTSNVSRAGLLCNLAEKVSEDDILWLSFDRATLNICEEMERRVFIYQNGVIGKVVRIATKDNGSFDVGVQFITREEKDTTYIYPEIHFLIEGKEERPRDEDS